MRTSGQETICERASAYYYDFLSGRKDQEIPENLWRHIACCDHCKSEVSRLDAAIGCEATPANSDLTVAARTTNLELHLALLGQSVDCDIAKPFLAAMADPLFELRTSTPITTHLHECSACGNDLSAIRGLDLTHSQHCRLGQMLAEMDACNHEMCRAAAEMLPSVAALTFDNVDPAILKHICICTDCRRLLFQHRQRLYDALPPHHKRNGVSCEDVAWRDLFDLCLPYSPAYEIPAALVAHVSSCRCCMDKLQAVLHTVTHIMDRPKSSIVTCLTTADLSRLQRSGSLSSKAEFSTQELHAEEETTRRPGQRNFRSFMKPLAAAAGILLIAMLALHGTKLTATDFGDVYARLAEVDTMHLKRIHPQGSEILQEIWISRNPDLKVFKDGDQFTIWDLDGKVRVVKNSVTGESQTAALDNATVRKVAATLIGPMHILPFTKLSDVPQGATWYRIGADSADAAIQGAELYEMVWLDKALGGAPVYRRWRGYVQPETKLPIRTEHYSRMDANAEYELLQVSEIAYPEAASVQEMVQQIGR